jgi:hypothetical protein
MPLNTGSRLGPYEIIGPLGEGGIATFARSIKLVIFELVARRNKIAR